MDNKIFDSIKGAMDELDDIADSFGVNRAHHISMLAGHLVEIRRTSLKMTKELEELRKFKEEHSDNKRDEVPAES